MCRVDGCVNEQTEIGRIALLFPPEATARAPGSSWEGCGSGVPEDRRGSFLSGPVIFIPGGQTQLQPVTRAAELVSNDVGKPFETMNCYLATLPALCFCTWQTVYSRHVLPGPCQLPPRGAV